MYMITSKCKVVAKAAITEARLATVLVNLDDDISIWWRRQQQQQQLIYGSRRPLCTGKVQDKHTGKSFEPKEHCCGYNPTIEYQALRRCAVPRYAYYDDSASSGSEIETETMEAEEAQYQKDKIPDPTKEQKIFRYDPNVNYQVVKQFGYLDSPDPPDSFTYYSTDSERETMEKQTRKDICSIASWEDLIFLDPNFKYEFSYSSVIASGTETETEVETETMAEEETSTHEDKILAGTKDEQLFRYDPRIKYEPLKRCVVPRFAFCDTSSTDWSDSADSSAFSDSEPETETKIMAAEEAQAQKDKILSGTKEVFRHYLVKSPSTDFESVAGDLTRSPSRNF